MVWASMGGGGDKEESDVYFNQVLAKALILCRQMSMIPCGLSALSYWRQLQGVPMLVSSRLLCILLRGVLPQLCSASSSLTLRLAVPYNCPQ